MNFKKFFYYWFRGFYIYFAVCLASVPASLIVLFTDYVPVDNLWVVSFLPFVISLIISPALTYYVAKEIGFPHKNEENDLNERE